MLTDSQIQGIIAVLTLLALVLSILAFVKTKQSSNRERVHRFTDRLFELDKILLEYPILQKKLHENNAFRGDYFCAATPHDEEYFRLKSFIYYHLNYFDEIFSIVAGDRELERAFEFDAWKNYVIRKMRHPFFAEVFKRERSIWGEKFRNFIDQNAHEIAAPVDPEIF